MRGGHKGGSVKDKTCHLRGEGDVNVKAVIPCAQGGKNCQDSNTLSPHSASNRSQQRSPPNAGKTQTLLARRQTKLNNKYRCNIGARRDERLDGRPIKSRQKTQNENKRKSETKTKKKHALTGPCPSHPSGFPSSERATTPLPTASEPKPRTWRNGSTSGAPSRTEDCPQASRTGSHPWTTRLPSCRRIRARFPPGEPEQTGTNREHKEREQRKCLKPSSVPSTEGALGGEVPSSKPTCDKRHRLQRPPGRPAGRRRTATTSQLPEPSAENNERVSQSTHTIPPIGEQSTIYQRSHVYTFAKAFSLLPSNSRA